MGFFSGIGRAVSGLAKGVFNVGKSVVRGVNSFLGSPFGSVASGLVGNIFERNNVQATNALNERMAYEMLARQDQMSWDHWNAVNAYNHPAQQMARLREAGLNPMLVYGGSSVTGNTSSLGTVPSVSAPQASPVPSIGRGILNGLAAYQDLAAKNSQMQLLDAQRELTLARAEKLRHDMTIMGRQSPVRTASFFDKFKKLGVFAGSVGGSLCGFKKLKNAVFGKPSSSVYPSVVKSRSPGLFSRVGSALKSSYNKLFKGFGLWSLLKPQSLAPF